MLRLRLPHAPKLSAQDLEGSVAASTHMAVAQRDTFMSNCKNSFVQHNDSQSAERAMLMWILQTSYWLMALPG